jgi:hypothetical protein
MSRFLIICLLFLVFIPIVYAGKQEHEYLCIRYLGVEDYQFRECRTMAKGSVSSFSRLSLSGSVLFSEDNPMFVSVSTDKNSLLKSIGMTEKEDEYVDNPLLHLAEEDSIIKRQPLLSTPEILETDGWDIHVYWVGYPAGRAADVYGEPDAVGYTVDCVTAIHSIKACYIAVSQCFDFYNDDIQAYRKILNYLSSTYPAVCAE